METIQVITVIAVLIFTAIGVASVIINLFGKSDKRKEVEKGNVIVRSDSYRLESNPCTPYENLWRKAGYPMRGPSRLRFIMIAGDREEQIKREAIYKDEILHLMNKGALCDNGRDDPSVREFCLGQTPLNQSIEYRIKTAEIMRKWKNRFILPP